MNIGLDDIEKIGRLSASNYWSLDAALRKLPEQVSNGAITQEQANQMKKEWTARQDKAQAIVHATGHALALHMYNTIKLNLTEAPAPLTDEERELIENEYNAI